MRLLLSFVVRAGGALALVWVMSVSQFVAAGVWYLLLAYLVHAAWSRLRVDVPRLWRWTAFRSVARSGGTGRVGRLRGDTL
jgi:hypothetical protein